MAAGSLNMMHVGQDVVIAGLFTQVVSFGFFITVAVVFHTRLNKCPTAQSLDPKTPWLKHLCVLYAASALVMIRSVFRVIEYIQGNDGYILRHEAFLYIFDAVLMLAVMALLSVFHPSGITSKVHEYRPACSDTIGDVDDAQMKG